MLGPIQNWMKAGDKAARLVEAATSCWRAGLARRRPRRTARPVLPAHDSSPTWDNGNPLVDEEQFGPVPPIIRCQRYRRGYRQSTTYPNGLGGSVWSKSTARAKEIALQLRGGSAWINKHGAIQPNAPFGGVKGSGFGVEFGEEGLFENTNVQVVYC